MQLILCWPLELYALADVMINEIGEFGIIFGSGNNKTIVTMCTAIWN